jgi:hypothetical protein
VHAPIFAHQRLALGVPEQRNWWTRAFVELCNQHEQHLYKLSAKDSAIALDAYGADFIRATQLLDWFGPSILYTVKNALITSTSFASVAEQVLTGQPFPEHERLLEALLNHKRPWISYELLELQLNQWRSPKVDLSRTKQELAVSLLLLAPIAEPTLDGAMHPSRWPGTAILPNQDDDDFEGPRELWELILATRAGLDDSEEMADELERIADIDTATTNLLVEWMQRKVSFGADLL